MAFTTTRRGGHSRGPYASFNLGHHVGDQPDAVSANRLQLQQQLPAGCEVQWLNQVHGTEVTAATGHGLPEADASVAAEPGVASAVLTADCLPVLFCDRSGTCVAAAHAGWRGLQAGVLEATVAALPAAADDLLAWMGPAIGPSAFEVGPEVREAFLAVLADRSSPAALTTCFRPSSKAGHYLADLYALARLHLKSVGVSAIYGGEHCTFTEAEDFFSYRRDGETGRMASVIALL
ncbi:peptidoglycan editing factor PgeF [Parahaliea maris]|uniref:peptidoglycan editing factor PgeF n=1 Tax=Parahaliea maris TaxID=2716870 RepID=UPI001F218053|nr:peptidoglycan editing factor PgeF [Parahaliea maris]